jgi:hypothetical protein
MQLIFGCAWATVGAFIDCEIRSDFRMGATGSARSETNGRNVRLWKGATFPKCNQHLLLSITKGNFQTQPPNGHRPPHGICSSNISKTHAQAPSGEHSVPSHSGGTVPIASQDLQRQEL